MINFQPGWSREREETQITNIRNERSGITVDSTDTKRIVKEFHGQLYANTFDNVDEIDQHLEYTKCQSLHKRKIPNLHSPLYIKEIKFKNKNFPSKKTTGLNGFTGEIYQSFREEIIKILHQLFKKFKEGVRSNWSH